MRSGRRPEHPEKDIAALALDLKKLSAAAVFSDLQKRLDESARTGVAVDPNVLELYYSILDEKDPVPYEGPSFDESWGKFQKRHAWLFSDDHIVSPERISTKSHKFRPMLLSRRGRQLLVVAAILILLAGVAFAVRFGNIVLDRGETIVSKQPCGVMIMDEATSDGYGSLDEALEDCGISKNGTLLTWIPVEYSVEGIHVTKLEGIIKINTVFRGNGDRRLYYRIVREFDGNSNVEYEKNDSYSDLWHINGIDYYLMNNNDDRRVMWDIGSTYCNLFGDVTVEQLKSMVESIRNG